MEKKYLKRKELDEVPIEKGISASSIEKILADHKDSIEEMVSTVIDTFEEKIQKTIDSVDEKLDKTVDQIIDGFKNTPLIKGDKGDNADEDKIIKSVSSKLPTKEEIASIVAGKFPKADDIAKKVLSKIPKSKSTLKLVTNNVETDPLSVIEKLLKEKSFKINVENVNGLDQTISALRNQIGRGGGYLHGGGLSTVSHDVTMTGDGTPTNPLSTVGASAIWGAIIGTLSDQTDLQTALDEKLSVVVTDSTLTGEGTIASPLHVVGGGSGAVDSVFGRSGVVVAVSGDYNTDLVTEATNLYYTQARFDTAFAAKTTDGLTQGVTNLYNQTHTGDVTGATALTIANDAVTNAKMANMATQTFKGRTTGGTGDPEDLTVAQAKTMLSLTGTNSGDVTLAGESYLSIASQVITANAVNLSGTNVTGTLAAARFPALTGDVTNSAGSLATTIANDAVTFAKMQNVASGSFLVRFSGGSGNIQEGTFGTGLSLSGAGVLSATGAVTSVSNSDGTLTISPTTGAVIASLNQAANLTLTGTQNFTNTVSFTSLPTSSAVPSTGNDLVNKTYVDVFAQGLQYKGSLNAKTTAALPTNTYNNGASGVGATLTGVALAALPAQDGQSLIVGQTLLVNDEATPANNGAYTVTVVGQAAVSAYVLTRIGTYNQAAEVLQGTFFSVLSGTLYGNTIWAMNSSDVTTMGTDAITFAQLSAPISYTGSLGVKLVGFDFQSDLSGSGAIGLTGNSLKVNVDNSTIQISSNQLALKGVQIGTTTAVSGTNGSILFISGGVIAQDNANLFYDNASNFMGLGTNAPAYRLDIDGDINFTDGSVIRTDGNVVFAASIANTTIYAGSGATIPALVSSAVYGINAASNSLSTDNNSAIFGNDSGLSINGFTDSATIMGNSADVDSGSSGAIAIGFQAKAGTGQVVFGADAIGTTSIIAAFFGGRTSDNSFASFDLHGGPDVNTSDDTTGGNFNLYAPAGTGSADGGSFNFYIAPAGATGSSTNPHFVAGYMDGLGNFVWGLSSPGFKIDWNGNIKNINSLDYNWPNSDPIVNGVLTRTAAGAINIDPLDISTNYVTGTLPTTRGGTGLTTWTQGDIPYYTSGTALSKLAKDTNATRYLSNQGTNNAPSWNQINLTNGVTGTLPIANGGTNATTAAAALTSLGAAGTSDVQVFTIVGANTWTKPAGAKSVSIIAIGAGSGGGSGRKGAISSVRCGGGGGAGGGFAHITLPASILGATETVTIGAGGTGGAAQTTNSTNGNAGTNGGRSAFGNWLQAGGTVSGGNGGTATAGAGGLVSNGGFPDSSPNTRGNGGGAASVTGGAGSTGGGNHYAACGGGAGGGITVGNVASAGGTGGGFSSSTTEGGYAGAIVGGTAGGTSTAGGAGNTAGVGAPVGGTGGGGGGGSTTTNGGAGGAGATYGAGGGGGGAAVNGVGNSGAGGAGASGIVIVTTYF